MVVHVNVHVVHQPLILNAPSNCVHDVRVRRLVRTAWPAGRGARHGRTAWRKSATATVSPRSLCRGAASVWPGAVSDEAAGQFTSSVTAASHWSTFMASPWLTVSPMLSLQGAVGPGLHGPRQHLPPTGPRHTRPASFSVGSDSASSSSIPSHCPHNYVVLAGRRQARQYLRNKYLRQKPLVSRPPILHGPQSDTVEHKVVPVEALQTTDTPTARAGQCPPAFQEVESGCEAAALSLRGRGAAPAPGQGAPPARTHCW